MPNGRSDVLLTLGAEQDLESIHDYVAEFDSPAHADVLLTRLLEACERLALQPERGVYPRELSALGIREYRQLIVKPYRVIYRVFGARTIIYMIVDGRRDMQSLLARRLLGG
ncbi:MAG: type II toxin-antitoxin system RelE/ParE family toxin [Xanthomonadaceae bacterium]|nr:type II toxin-antitoxin system RelE/ParE family toxin [Xanthomonadaceae bacterium]